MTETKEPQALTDAKVRHFDALADQAKAEANKSKAHAALSKLEVAEATIELARLTEKRKDELATDLHHHLFVFSASVGDSSVAACIKQLTTWMRNDPGEPIEIVFNSPGGDVIAGLALYDFIQTVRRSGSHVTTSTIGYAASMAGVLLQAGDTRVMGAQSWLMLHEASFGAQGKTGEVEDRVEWVKRVQERFLDIFATRCHATDAPKKLTKAQIKKRWTRTDFWISSDEALSYGLVDEVR